MSNNRADSAHTQTDIMAGALRKIQPPEHIKLRRGDMPFWDVIIAARHEWTDVDLAHAANLARCQADVELMQEKLNKEGHVIENARGTPVANPAHCILETLSRRAVALSRMVQVHAAATMGESKLGRGKNTKKRESIHAMEAIEDDDLIARPMN